jgi:hypothetical protein
VKSTICLVSAFAQYNLGNVSVLAGPSFQELDWKKEIISAGVQKVRVGVALFCSPKPWQATLIIKRRVKASQSIHDA